MDVRSLGRKKPRLFALEVHAGFGKRYAANGAHLRVNLEQEIEILLHRGGERIDFVRVVHSAVAAGSGAIRTSSRFTRAEAFAISIARLAAASTATRLKSADAANPHAPSAITRTPMPSDSDSEA